MKRWMTTGWVVALVLLFPVGMGHAGEFQGTIYYTTFAGGVNVNSVHFTYDDTTHTVALSNMTGIAAAPGADGIIFSPNGNLLVGGQGTGFVYEYTTGGTLVTAANAGTASFHLALDPSGKKLYTSNFEGPLDVLPLDPSGHPHNGTVHGVSGDDNGVTQLAFAAGKTFYVDGNPNGFGNVGAYNLSNDTTSRFFSGLRPAHGIIFDPFTNLVTMFGAGSVGTFDPNNPTGTLKERDGINADFDQGAVDGHGHAFIAGNNELTFIDYSKTGDITSDKNIVEYFTGFNNIDDLAPLVGPGAPPPSVPEPSSLALLSIATFTCAGYCGWRRKKRPAV